MARRNRPLRQRPLGAGGQLQEAEGVGHGRPPLAHTRRDLLVREAELVDQLLVGRGFLERVEVDAVQVLDQRLFKAGDVGANGDIQVVLGGRSFRISRAFFDDIAEQKLQERIGVLHKALLVFHSPTDEIVGIENASRIFTAAKHPKSFVSLAGADHLLSRRSDATYVANVIHAWAERYLEAPEVAVPDSGKPNTVLVRETRQGKFQQEVTVGKHRFLADEPADVGGLDSGPGPYDLLLAGLGACTAITLRLYAERKALPLERVTVELTHSRIYAADCESCETKEGMLDRIDRSIALSGKLDAEQRKRLMEIADKCPVHRTLTSEIDIRTVQQPAVGD